VKNSGRGFAAAVSALFSTRGRGTGLGLAIVRQLSVSMLDIYAEPNQQKGARFVIELPVGSQ
jgi:signal transduction histidine kinase